MRRGEHVTFELMVGKDNTKKSHALASKLATALEVNGYVIRSGTTYEITIKNVGKTRASRP